MINISKHFLPTRLQFFLGLSECCHNLKCNNTISMYFKYDSQYRIDLCYNFLDNNPSVYNWLTSFLELSFHSASFASFHNPFLIKYCANLVIGWSFWSQYRTSSTDLKMVYVLVYILCYSKLECIDTNNQEIF